VSRASLFVSSPSLGYERLFTTSSEPVLIIDSASERIVAANPAAAAALRTPLAALIGTRLRSVFDAHSGCALGGLLDAARAARCAAAVSVRVPHCGVALRLGLSLLKTGSACYLLARLGGGRRADRERTVSSTFQAIESAADGFVVTDIEFRVDYANQGFLEMVRLRGADEIRGMPLTTWFALSAAQRARLHRQLLEREATVKIRTSVRCSRNRVSEAELCAVAVPESGGQPACWGFCVRQLARVH
jgi:PAS domain-containing protein